MNLEKDLVTRFIVQILLGNRDLNASNMEIIYTGEKPIFAPFYDFGDYGEIHINGLIKRSYKLPYKSDIDAYQSKPLDTIKDFFQFASKKELELYKEYLEKLKAISLDTVLKSIYEIQEVKIPFLIRKKLKQEVNENIKLLSSIKK